MIDLGLGVHAWYKVKLARSQWAMLFGRLVHLLTEVCPFEHTEMFKLCFGNTFNICTRWDAYCILNVVIVK